jgi:hypothetical protein
MHRTPTRRTFLKLGAAAASTTAARASGAVTSGGIVRIVTEANSPITTSEPVKWATEKLADTLASKGVLASGEGKTRLTVLIMTARPEILKGRLDASAISKPETTALFPGQSSGTPSVVVTGADARGIAYGLLELADRVRLSDDPVLALHVSEPLVESSPNRVRSVARPFLSEIEDKPWFYDRGFWTRYLDSIAAARFNRFNFALGFGYDFPRGVTGDYLHFPYPYLVEVPGYEQVHVEPALHSGERKRNLETLQFIAIETARRGLEFQLGIWTHAYVWTDSPNSDHHIVGLTPQTHAAYCRDALAALLKACPQITGLTLRIHGESGIPEGSYDFWQTLFEAVKSARTPDGKPRILELDLHAKGLDDRMISIARTTGMPVKAGAKFWAEHLGLGYHQAEIRATEYPKEAANKTFALSEGTRSFTRYGYGDFYQQGFGLELLYRVWPGTQRHLLWADPALASGYGRAAHFCGAAGMELCEPLTFKGREGSGYPGGRNSYADASLAPANLDTAKFAAMHMLWGRYLYNPDTAPEFYHRYLREQFGPAGPALETTLASSSRILPLITTAWLPSASNHAFWPEMFTHLSLLPYTSRPPYTDSPAPHNASAISPLDPQLFTTVDQHAENLVAGKIDARYNTGDVIGWLEAFVATSTKGLAEARRSADAHARDAEFRRAEEDILILNGLGIYYANLFRAALLYSIYEHTHDPAVSAASLAAFRKAREAWAQMADRAKAVYTMDVSYGSISMRRGHWSDRLAAIDVDLTAVEQHFASASGEQTSAHEILNRVLNPKPRVTIDAQHAPASTFAPGSALPLTVSAPQTVSEAILWYRHVNQGERWRSTPMQRSGANHAASIPADYTQSPFPLQYYFELRTTAAATLYPALNPTLSNQPYFAIYKRT